MTENMQRILNDVALQQRQRSGAQTLSTAATIGGCCGLFDLCTDADLMSLSMGGQEPFLDWLGWEKTDLCMIRKSFITWVRPAASQGSRTSGIVTDPCGDSNGAEWGKCDFILEGFARLRRHTPTRDVTKNLLRLCDMQPRYRLDGSPITDNIEFDMRIVTEALLQDLRRMIITGTHTVGTDDGQFDGLQQLINTGYADPEGVRCCMMDSIVVDWNQHNMCDATAAGHGTTWNGVALATGWNFINVLLAVYRRIRRRMQMAPALNANLAVGDMVLVMPAMAAQCLMDCFTCWSLCISSLDLNMDSRKYRDNLNGGMFGGGRIFLDGFEIPIMPYEWALTGNNNLSDAYLLTNKVGGQRLINGQFNDLSKSVPKMIAADYTDGGRLLTWTEQDKTCLMREVEMQPRLLAWAPWAQARFIDVLCSTPGGALSPDPWDLSFFPECSFHTEICSELHD